MIGCSGQCWGGCGDEFCRVVLGDVRVGAMLWGTERAAVGLDAIGQCWGAIRSKV